MHCPQCSCTEKGYWGLEVAAEHLIFRYCTVDCHLKFWSLINLKQTTESKGCAVA